MAFGEMINILFMDPALSKPATYHFADTDALFLVRVISRQPDTVTGFGDGQFNVSTTLFDVRISEVPDPQIGDQVICNGITYVVQSEPKADREQLIWTLDVRPA